MNDSISKGDAPSDRLFMREGKNRHFLKTACELDSGGRTASIVHASKHYRSRISSNSGLIPAK